MNHFKRQAESGDNAGCRGAFLLEFAIVLPLLVMLFFLSLELNFYMLDLERIEFMARESAKTAFRKCHVVPAAQQGAAGSYVSTCLRNSVADIAAYGQNTYGDFKVIVSYYDLTETSPGVQEVRAFLTEEVAPINTSFTSLHSKIDTATVQAKWRTLLDLSQTVIVTEIYMKNRTAGLGLHRSMFNIGRYYYAAAVA